MTGPREAEAARRLDALIEKAEQGGSDEEFRAQGIAFLTSLLGGDHRYTLEFDAQSTPTGQEVLRHKRGQATRRGVGVLRAIREDAEQGQLLRTLQQELLADVFVDYLEMAQHLLDNEMHEPAASLAGATSEETLRQEAKRRGFKAGNNLPSLNDVFADKGIYGRMQQKQVKVWIDLRDKADHGRFEEFTAEDVRSMMRDLPGFIDRHVHGPSVGDDNADAVEAD